MGDEKKVLELVRRFAKKHERFKEIEAQYKEYKGEFEEVMMRYFDTLGRNRKSVEFEAGDEFESGEIIRVAKTEKTSIEWNADRLRQKLPKELHKAVFKKRYEITDFVGLVKYLKACGVDPNVFKTYVTSEESVDVDALDKLSDQGKIGVNNIAGCYFVKCQKPYFTVTVKRGKGNGE